MYERRKVKKKPREEQKGSPLWMTTYSDMVTLLLAFFILLFSMSVIDVERFEKILSAVQISFVGHAAILDSAMEVEEGTDDLSAEQVNIDPQQWEIVERWEEMREAKYEVQAFLAEAGLEEEVELRLEERGIVMDLPETLLFHQAQAVLKEEAWPVLGKIAQLLRESPGTVLVEGHTCNIPMVTVERFPTNWELSSARAVKVVRYLEEEAGLDPGRLVAMGYGEHAPIAGNETEEGRERNRRVTIVMSMF